MCLYVTVVSCALVAGPGVGSAGAELLPRVLDRIFAALVYEGGEPAGRRSRAVKNVRRHAASLLVKLGSKVSAHSASLHVTSKQAQQRGSTARPKSP